MELNREVHEGEVWWAVPDPTSVGREQDGQRPVVIVSNADYHHMVTTMALAVPVTTVDRHWLNHVELGKGTGLGRPSFAMTEQVRAVSRQRLLRRAGATTAEELMEIRSWVVDSLQG